MVSARVPEAASSSAIVRMQVFTNSLWARERRPGYSDGSRARTVARVVNERAREQNFYVTAKNSHRARERSCSSESLCSGGFFIPRMRGYTLVPILDAIVEMFIGGGAELKIVQAGEPQPLPQVLVESVQSRQLRGQRGYLPAGWSREKHLI